MEVPYGRTPSCLGSVELQLAGKVQELAPLPLPPPQKNAPSPEVVWKWAGHPRLAASPDPCEPPAPDPCSPLLSALPPRLPPAPSGFFPSCPLLSSSMGGKGSSVCVQGTGGASRALWRGAGGGGWLPWQRAGGQEEGQSPAVAHS